MYTLFCKVIICVDNMICRNKCKINIRKSSRIWVVFSARPGWNFVDTLWLHRRLLRTQSSTFAFSFRGDLHFCFENICKNKCTFECIQSKVKVRGEEGTGQVPVGVLSERPRPLTNLGVSVQYWLELGSWHQGRSNHRPVELHAQECVGISAWARSPHEPVEQRPQVNLWGDPTTPRQG